MIDSLIPVRLSRRAVALAALALAVWVALAAWGAVSPVEAVSRAGRLGVHVRTAGAVSALPVLALVVGFAALRVVWRRWGDGGEPSLALSLSLGWGLLSYGGWLLGAVGLATGRNWFHPLVFGGAAGLAVVCSWGSLGALGAVLWRRWRALGSAPASPGVRVAGAVFALLAVRQLLTALTPPFVYDVLEYHLPQVRHVLSTGSWTAIVGNSYTKMPQGVEMLYALGRLLEGPGGELAPKLVHLFLGWSAAAVVGAIVGEMGGGRGACALGALLFLAHPVSFTLLADAYVGMGSALFASAGLLCWLRWMRGRGGADPWLGAVLMGLAFSTKYPVGGTAVLAFLGILTPMGCLAGGGRVSGRRVLATVVALGAVAGAAYGPWLLRSVVCERSLFPPMMPSGVQRDAPYARAMQGFMAASHRPEFPASLGYAKRLRRRAPEAGTLLFALAVVYLLWPRGVDASRRGLAAYVALGYLVWVTSPYAPNRYLAPLVPALAALGGLALDDAGLALGGRGRWGAVVALGCWAGWLLSLQTIQAGASGWLDAGLGGASRRAFLEAQLGMTGRFFSAIDVAAGRGGGKVLMVYEARAAGVAAGGAEVWAHTVFDPCPLWSAMQGAWADDPAEVARRLRAEGFTHVAVNEIELARLIGTYPVASARRTRDWIEAMQEEPAPGGWRPAMLSMWWYYAPFYYAGAPVAWRERYGAAAAAHGRWARFLDYLSSRAVWGDTMCGARIFVAAL